MNMYNGNLLIKPRDNSVQLGNGLTVSEQRGKRDLIWGTVIDCQDFGKEHPCKGAEILYPLYAADSVQLTINNETSTYHIVKLEDIIMFHY